VLQKTPLAANSDGFDFDTQIIAQVLHVGGRIVEVPIPTYYGDEICYVNGMKYASDVVRDVLEYRLAVRGFGTVAWVPDPDDYAFKEGDGSSHAVILHMLAEAPPLRILDLGCSSGLLAERIRKLGHYVVGVDAVVRPGVEDRTDEFYQADLAKGLPAEVGDGFDCIIAGDVIEHLARPRDALLELRQALRPGGQLLLSVPNFGHWYPRARVALGIFGYDRRGILDETHLRFFSRLTLRRLVRACGFDILEESATGLPFGTITGGDKVSVARRVDTFLVRLRPTLFAYQYVMRLTPHAEDTIQAARLESVRLS
jgi:SAM-dependent methyltransferase